MTASSVVDMNSGRIMNDGNSGTQLYPVEVISPQVAGLVLTNPLEGHDEKDIPLFDL